MNTRRDFLKHTGFFAAGSLLVPGLLQAANYRQTQKCRCAALLCA